MAALDKPQGGADLMLAGLQKHVGVPEEINMINSVCDPELIDPDKINILWQHLPADQPVVQGIRDKYFLRQLDAQVYVSHWQHEKYRYIHQIPLDNAVVIKNAIEPIEYVPRKVEDKIRLIYTSVPYRGLEILLDALELIDREDVVLDAYSSMRLYGKDCQQVEGPKYQHILDRAAETKNVVLHDCVSNDEIRSALQRAHIFAYPCIFEETACLSLIEAGAAGCRLVTTNIGALAETGSEFVYLVPMQSSREALASRYAHNLESLIGAAIMTNEDDLLLQSAFFNVNYGWQNRKREWINLFHSLIHAT